MKITRILWFCVLAAVWMGCSSGQSGGIEGRPRSDLLLDSLTSFAQSIQEDRFEKALQCLSPSERAKFEAAGGAQNPVLQRRMKSLRLSTLARRPSVRLEKEGLEGIFEELPDLPNLPPDSDPSSAPNPEESPGDIP